MANPDIVKASYTKEGNLFDKHHILYLNPGYHMHQDELFEMELFDTFHPVFGITHQKNEKAFLTAKQTDESFDQRLQNKAATILNMLEQEQRLGIIFLGKPYHYDLGINHGIPEQLQQMGFPIFTIESLPRHPKILKKLQRI